MKKVFALLFVTILCVTTLTLSAYADEGDDPLIRAKDVPEAVIEYVEANMKTWAQSGLITGDKRLKGELTWGGGWRGMCAAELKADSDFTNIFDQLGYEADTPRGMASYWIFYLYADGQASYPFNIVEFLEEQENGERFHLLSGGQVDLLSMVEKLDEAGGGDRDIVVGIGLGVAFDITDPDDQKVIVRFNSEYDGQVYPAYSYLKWYKDLSDIRAAEDEASWKEYSLRWYTKHGEYPDPDDPQHLLFGGGIDFSAFVPAPVPQKPFPLLPLLCLPAAALIVAGTRLLLFRRRGR